MFSSGLLAVQRKPNPLNFRSAKRIVCVLVDGLGAENILQRSGHAPWLSAHVKAGAVSHAGFPSTTSANIASFATGLTPGEHGLIGHQVFDRFFDEKINLLTGWNERTDPIVWQPNQTVSEMAFASGVGCHVIGHEEYRNTGYTVATMRRAEYVAAESMVDRFDAARTILNSPGESITYLYIPELDKYGHRYGWQSPGWANILEELDGLLSKFAATLPKDCALVVTADHGMIDSELDQHLVIDDAVEQGGLLEWFGGDTRVGYLYLKDASLAKDLQQKLEPQSALYQAVLTKDAIAANWFGPVGELASQRLPELMLLARSNFTLFHSVYSKKRSIEMIAHHGGLSSNELRIPLIRVGV
ncbi:MAG: alkaline phosphatase family protein [Aquiluna sp.]|nr:alkaline phosphatase family protein [Aquiluna sp.]